MTKMDFVRSLGADHIVDHTREDVTKNGQEYDLIFDTAAYRSIPEYKRILSPGEFDVLAGGSMARIFQLMLIWMAETGKNMGLIVESAPRRSAVHHRNDQWGQGRPIIDKRYPLNETAEALRYLEGGFARGKVVITV